MVSLGMTDIGVLEEEVIFLVKITGANSKFMKYLKQIVRQPKK